MINWRRSSVAGLSHWPSTFVHNRMGVRQRVARVCQRLFGSRHLLNMKSSPTPAVGSCCRCAWSERSPVPCEDYWRSAAPRRGLPGHQRPHLASDRDLHEHSLDEDLEPVYATISEITDSLDRTSVLPDGQQLFHGLFHVFADLAALPTADLEDGSSAESSSASPPPSLTDAPPSRRGNVPHPIAGRVEERPLPTINRDHRHVATSPHRFYTYCWVINKQQMITLTGGV